MAVPFHELERAMQNCLWSEDTSTATALLQGTARQSNDSSNSNPWTEAISVNMSTHTSPAAHTHRHLYLRGCLKIPKSMWCHAFQSSKMELNFVMPWPHEGGQARSKAGREVGQC